MVGVEVVELEVGLRRYFPCLRRVLERYEHPCPILRRGSLLSEGKSARDEFLQVRRKRKGERTRLTLFILPLLLLLRDPPPARSKILF